MKGLGKGHDCKKDGTRRAGCIRKTPSGRDRRFRLHHRCRYRHHGSRDFPNPLISSTTGGLEINKHRCIVADEANGQTSREGVFAGGDAVTGAATVILAMEAGTAGARGIHEY